MVVLQWLLTANIIAWFLLCIYLLGKLTIIGIERLFKWLKKKYLIKKNGCYER